MNNLLQVLASASPIASAASSLLFLLVVAVIYATYQALFNRKSSKSNEKTTFGHIWDSIKAADKAIIHSYSYITGTRYNRKSIRLIILLCYFLGLTAASSLVPFPYNFIAIFFGILGIFIVFRHWSIDEDEVMDNLPKDRKQLPIDGDLHIEVKIAVGFLFVFTPIAFSSLQQHGYGFETAPDIGPFTFLLYTLIETLKAGSIVDYYDLWADRLGFDKYSGVKDPTDYAKWMIMGYRLALNLLILVAIKRLLDIAKRKSEGYDLRHIEEVLRGKDDQEHKEAVEQLKDFALRGRGNARDLLEKIAVPNPNEGFVLGPHERYAAANALFLYGRKRMIKSSLDAAGQGYRKLIADEWSEDKQPELWAETNHAIGVTLFWVGIFDNDSTLLLKAVDHYHMALKIYSKEKLSKNWAHTQQNLGDAFRELGTQQSNADYFRQAITSYDNALEVYDKRTPKEECATLLSYKAHAHQAIGELTDSVAEYELAIQCYRDEQSIVTKTDDFWPDRHVRIAKLYLSIYRIAQDKNVLEEAKQHIALAREVWTETRVPLHQLLNELTAEIDAASSQS